jgi:hypothetical protein
MTEEERAQWRQQHKVQAARAEVAAVAPLWWPQRVGTCRQLWVPSHAVCACLRPL